MIACAPAPSNGGFVTNGERWSFAGTLTFADAASVLDATRALALPKAGVVDLAGIGHADSSALAVMMALKRRAVAEGVPLAYEAIPPALLALAHVYGVEDLLAG
jgi:phospholipid transport system transporter-binding protein